MTPPVGTYFTSWQYDNASPSDFELGPILVVGSDNSLVVDGVTMKAAIVTSTLVQWSSMSGNPSSGILQFVFSQQLQAMTFNGIYWLQGQDPPASNNFWGFNTQPALGLASWNNTYHCYTSINKKNDPIGDLIVSSPTVTFDGKQIVKPIYTGLNNNGNDTNELAWYTSDGNDNNVAVSFFNSASQPGIQLLNGCIWDAGANRLVGAAGLPANADNLFGSTREDQNEMENANLNEVEMEAGEAHQAQVGGVAAAAVAALAAAAAAAANVGVDADNAKAAQDVGKAQADEADEADEAPDAADDDADDLEDATEDIAEDVEGTTANLGKVDSTKRSSKRPTGLSAKQLLDLRNKA